MNERSDRQSPDTHDDVAAGLRPEDRVDPAPVTVPDAHAAFAARGPRDGVSVDADPQEARTEDERRKERAELEGIVKAQREGEALSGFAPRKMTLRRVGP